MRNKEYFNNLYNEYYPQIVAYIHKHIFNHEDAEEMAQEIMLAAYKHIDEFDEKKASFRTWIYVITNNRLKNYYRDKKQLTSIDDEENPIDIASKECVEQAAIVEEDKRYVLEAINSLPEREKIIVVGKYFENKSSSEIAASLGIAEGNVRVILNRTLKKLQSYLSKQGYEFG